MKVKLIDKKKIALTNLFFLTEISKRLEAKNFNKDKDKECTVLITSKDYDYCFTSISTIEKYYSRDNLKWDKWKCKLLSYYKTANDKFYCYAFKFTKE